MKNKRRLVEALAQHLYESREGRRPAKSDTWAKLVAPVSDGRDGKWKHANVAAFYRNLAREALEWFERELVVEVSAVQVAALQRGMERTLRAQCELLVKGSGKGKPVGILNGGGT